MVKNFKKTWHLRPDASVNSDFIFISSVSDASVRDHPLVNLNNLNIISQYVDEIKTIWVFWAKLSE